MKVDGAEKVVSITRVKSEEEEEISDFNSIEDETNIEEVEIVETKED